MVIKKTNLNVVDEKKISSSPKKAPVIKKVVATKNVVKQPVKAVKKTLTPTVAVKKCSVCSKRCKSEHAFWINNGPVVHSLEDLLKAMKEMTDEQYLYHTKREGNDFVNWVKDCFNDTHCVADLKKVKTRVGAIRVLTSRCAKY